MSLVTNNATTPINNTRLLQLATKQMAASEDKKANRLNHNRLPTTKSTNGNVSVTVSISAKEQKVNEKHIFLLIFIVYFRNQRVRSLVFDAFI